MEYCPLNEDNRQAVNDFIIKHWYTTEMVIRGRIYDMVHLYHNALDVSRKLKPEIPLVGDYDIPLRHEIEFEKDMEC
ncbi:MAG: hypothetical protein Q4G60_06775 [bacterium]|nr:hypothetical protein [bacterium]